MVRGMRALGLLVFLTSTVLSGCGDSASSNAPAGPSSPTVTSLIVTGTLNFNNLGQTSQMTATARYAKGTTQDVTTQASWTSSDSTIAVVSATGLVTSAGLGTATITATYHNVSGATKVTVTRPPSVMISGLVTESVPTTSTMLAGVRIEFTDGTNQGRFGTTDGSGRYQITQVPAGSYTLRASLAGYVDSTKSVTVNQDAAVDFALVPTPRTIWFTRTGVIAPGNPACYEAAPCQLFNLPPVHNAGALNATLLWGNSSAYLALQLVNLDTGQILASVAASQTTQYLATQIPGPGNYQLRVVGSILPASIGITLNVTSCPN